MNRLDLRRVFHLTPYKTAQQTLFNTIRLHQKGEETALSESLGRVLSEDVFSAVNVPDSNRSVYDGYALHSVDTNHASTDSPVLLRRVNTPSELQNTVLSHECAMYVTSGSPLPIGADAVIKIEHTRLNNALQITRIVKQHENVALVGEDIKQEQKIFRKGHRLRPQDIGLLAGIGVQVVKVFQKPIVGILSVGSELIQQNARTPHRVSNNHALTLLHLVNEAGAHAIKRPIVPDITAEIIQEILSVINHVDVLVTISGCSIGLNDYVPDAIAEIGQILFHGITLSPGKVIGAAKVKDKLVLMLPGYIVPLVAGFFLFLAPLLTQKIGLQLHDLFPTIIAELADPIQGKNLAKFQRLQLGYIKDKVVAHPIHGGSSQLFSLVNSNGFTIIPPNHNLRKGQKINVTLYNVFEFACYKH